MIRLLLLLTFCLGGCASFSYDPETGKVKYASFMKDIAGNLSITKTSDTLEVKLENLSSTETLSRTIESMSKFK